MKVHGLLLDDLNRLIRRCFVRLGEHTGPLLSQWLNSETGEVRASGWITANLRGHDEGWFHFKSSSVDQRLTLTARPRHFGGRQWCYHSRRQLFANAAIAASRVGS